MAENRYHMKSKSGHYVECLDKAALNVIRADNITLFKNARVGKALQTWEDVIKVGVVYPPFCNTRRDFIRFNKKR